MDPASAGITALNGEPSSSAPAATVGVLVVTWNRWKVCDDVLHALARQRYPRSAMHVVVIDNGSTDGTVSNLAERWKPDRIVDNPTEQADVPAFAERSGGEAGPNAGGWGSLTIIANRHNHGGCGGFNTGLAFAEARLGRSAGEGPDFVWLVDDDVDLPDDALERLHAAMKTDAKIGLVGSRTVDFNDRRTTIETTIYFDRRRGAMCDEPPEHHPQHASHREWIGRVGATKGPGGQGYAGLRDVDVVSACSLLARWSAVREVGFWDRRYFIYCDDADWCLRFARAGYRVVLNLDAVVFHTPWNLKLTPTRIYYAQRNAMWMMQKVLEGGELRRAMAGWMKRICVDALRAAAMRRLFHAEIIRRTALDTAANRGGRFTPVEPAPEPVVEALRRAGALKVGSRIAVLCGQWHSVQWADELREHVSASLGEGERPRWIYAVRNDLPDPRAGEPGQPERVIYSGRLRSRLRRQAPFFRRPPAAVVVFEQTNDLPLLPGRWTIHIDRKKPTIAQAERHGLGRLALFALRWIPAAARCAAYALTVRPSRDRSKYGGVPAASGAARA